MYVYMEYGYGLDLWKVVGKIMEGDKDFCAVKLGRSVLGLGRK